MSLVHRIGDGSLSESETSRVTSYTWHLFTENGIAQEGYLNLGLLYSI